MRNDVDDQARTVFCGNLSEDVTDIILYELFNQAGPVECVRRPKDPSGRPKSFGFVIFKHDCSVPYAIELFKGTKLFNRNINVDSRSNNLHHIPVLDSHVTEFTGIVCENERRWSEKSEHDHRNQNKQRGHSSRHHRERDENGASSWSELKNSPSESNKYMSNGFDQDNLRPRSNFRGYPGENMPHPAMLDFNALLQMGQQMMIPGVMAAQGFAGVGNMMPPMVMNPLLGNGMFPSMQGRISGGERNSPPRERSRRDHEDRERRDYHGDRERKDYVERKRRDHHEERERSDYGKDRETRRGQFRERERRRDHPYNDRNRSEDHKHHDRGYSSLRSSHDRERRDRRSHY